MFLGLFYSAKVIGIFEISNKIAKKNQKIQNNYFIIMLFSSNLRFLRKTILGLSQSELAKIIDRSPGTISAYETGLVEPDLTTLLKLCEILQTTPTEILLFDLKAKHNDNATQENNQMPAAQEATVKYPKKVPPKLHLEQDTSNSNDERYKKAYFAQLPIIQALKQEIEKLKGK